MIKGHLFVPLVDDGCLRLCFSFVIVTGPQRDRSADRQRDRKGIASGIFDHIGNLLDINPAAALIELGRRRRRRRRRHLNRFQQQQRKIEKGGEGRGGGGGGRGGIFAAFHFDCSLINTTGKILIYININNIQSDGI